MSALLKTVDPDGLLEFSVVFTDRSLNHMSKQFQQVMRDIDAGLKQVYGADATALVPGGGTFAMEAVARQFAGGEKVLVVRNGWFSFRWSQIVDAGQIADPTQLELITRVNGEQMQHVRVADLVFKIPTLVEYCSSFTSLEPGDVIATGTPGGVGAARKPPVWLKPGDTVEVEIEGLGLLTNTVVAG